MKHLRGEWDVLSPALHTDANGTARMFHHDFTLKVTPKAALAPGEYCFLGGASISIVALARV